MKNKFFWLYIAGSLLAVGLLIKDIVTTESHIPPIGDILLDTVPAILFVYLAFKVYHEKKDKEMM